MVDGVMVALFSPRVQLYVHFKPSTISVCHFNGQGVGVGLRNWLSELTSD